MNEKRDISQSEAQVLQYLGEHPDLLGRHPEILAELEIPHACGRAVSLVEHQISVLRDQNRRLKQRLRELIDNARTNQALVRRLLRVSLSLFECTDMNEVSTRLHQALTGDFGVDVATMRLFGPPLTRGADELTEFSRLDEQTKTLFEHVLRAGKPVCGRLHPAQLEFLFGERRAEIASSALLPLGKCGALGMLAIGSRDPQRFHPAQGTEFLDHVRELVTRAIRPYLAVA